MKNILTLLLLGFGLASMISCKKNNETINAVTTEPESPKPVTTASQKYNINIQESTIDWMGSKPTGKHRGTIKLSQGEVFVKDSAIETGRFVIDMNSIKVTDPEDPEERANLEKHLKGSGKEESADHFFNTNKYPTGSFEITAITPDNKRSIVEGNLTLKGTTKNIKFPAAIHITDTTVTINSDAFKINRILWNINYNSKSAIENLGNQYIDDDIELKVNVILKRE
jgi:polyisoprenoid-binding protein YceI